MENIQYRKGVLKGICIVQMDYKRIGLRIRNARRKKGISQERVCEMVGLSLSHMSNIETGNTKMSLPVLVAIANVLGVTTDDLLYDCIRENKKIYLKEIDDMLKDCDEFEIQVMTDIMKAVKTSLREHIRQNNFHWTGNL